MENKFQKLLFKWLNETATGSPMDVLPILLFSLILPATQVLDFFFSFSFSSQTSDSHSFTQYTCNVIIVCANWSVCPSACLSVRPSICQGSYRVERFHEDLSTCIWLLNVWEFYITSILTEFSMLAMLNSLDSLSTVSPEERTSQKYKYIFVFPVKIVPRMLS